MSASLSQFRANPRVVVGEVYPFQASSQVVFTASELSDALLANTANLGNMHISTNGLNIPNASILAIWERYGQPAISSFGVYDICKSIFNPAVAAFAGTNVSDYGNSGHNYLSDGIAGNGSGVWLAVQAKTGSTFHIARSSNNGSTWAGVTIAAVATECRFVKFVNSLFWAGIGPALYSSSDGITWALRHTSSTLNITDLAHNGSRYVAVGTHTIAAAAFQYMTSTDGITWTDNSHAIAETTTGWVFDYDSTVGRFAAVGYGNTTTADRPTVYSTNGTSWSSGTAIPQSGSDAQNVFRVRANQGRYYLSIVQAGNVMARLLSSTDGSTWAAVGSNALVIGKHPTVGLLAVYSGGSGSTVRPQLVSYSSGSTTQSFLSDWHGLSSNVNGAVAAILPAISGSAVLSIATGTAGTRGVYYTADTSLKSMRVPIMTRVH